MLAAEVGAEVNVVRRASFLHDIGKVLTTRSRAAPHHRSRLHPPLRASRQAVVQAVMGHHDHDPERTGDRRRAGPGGGRCIGLAPGRAARERRELRLRRLEALEEVADSFDGVEKSFAIQAGREVRIIVKPEQVDDLAAMRLARDIVKKIEETLQYPGQIKVTVVRETRAVDYAR